MKKYKIIFILFILIIFIGIMFVNRDKKEEKFERLKKNNNFYTILLETDTGSGNYVESTNDAWPTDGYIIDEEKSGCENGGELTWNDESKKVQLLSPKSDRCYLYFKAYVIPQINSVEVSGITNTSVTVTANVTEGTNPITAYYYSINGGDYINSNSNRYTFNNLESGMGYTINVYVVDEDGYETEVSSIIAQTTLPTLANICSNGTTLANCIKEYYSTYGEGVNGLYLHDGNGIYGEYEAGDGLYRYSGTNPINYVCFGANTSPCPEDNLYRILGVYGSNVDRVKLIKNNSLGNYYWTGSSSNSSNTWNSSALNSNILNGTYLSGLGTTWSDMMQSTSWRVNKLTWSFLSDNNAKAINETEVIDRVTTYSAKIGLMYIADYGYAAHPKYWSINLENYNEVDSNWLATGNNEWTITSSSESTAEAYYITNTGALYYNRTLNSTQATARPVFYFNSNIFYAGGTGEKNNPIYVTD